jgi:hypothetical protein
VPPRTGATLANQIHIADAIAKPKTQKPKKPKNPKTQKTKKLKANPNKRRRHKKPQK